METIASLQGVDLSLQKMGGGANEV